MRGCRRRRQAAGEIPARFVSLAGHYDISAFYEADDLLLPHISRASPLNADAAVTSRKSGGGDIGVEERLRAWRERRLSPPAWQGGAPPGPMSSPSRRACPAC